MTLSHRHVFGCAQLSGGLSKVMKMAHVFELVSVYLQYFSLLNSFKGTKQKVFVRIKALASLFFK